MDRAGVVKRGRSCFVSCVACQADRRFVPFEYLMGGDASQREILERLRWPDRRQRLEEQARLAQALTPTERLERVDALTRLCLELAGAAGNLEAARRYREWREAQWRQSIREVIRQYERRQLGHA